MKLSEQLKNDNDCGDFGKALHEYTKRSTILEEAIIAMVDDGWLHYGHEGMSEAQKKLYVAYNSIKGK